MMGFIALLPIPKKTKDASTVVSMRPSVLAPRSALGLRPRSALSSAQVVNQCTSTTDVGKAAD